MSKPSAIQRELNIIIVLNNGDLTQGEKKKEIREENETGIEMVNMKKEEKEEKGEGKRVIGGGSITYIKNKLQKGEPTFLIKDRINKTDDDIFQTIFEYNEKTSFCELSPDHIYRSIYNSDFVIFINNGISDSVYEPMCIAFIEIYKKDSETNFLYISTFCSNKNFGQCGTFLMNTIKYIATLLNCNEIRIESANEENTLDFYERNRFTNISSDPVGYTHYYITRPKDSVFKPLPDIQGNASIPLYTPPDIQDEESIPWYIRFKKPQEKPVNGGKHKKKQRTKKSKYTKKHKMKRRTKRKF